MDGHELIFTGGCERKARLDVLPSELGKISENLLHGHAGGEVGEHIRHGDAHSPDAWPASTFPRLDGKDIGVTHKRNLLQKGLGGELSFPPTHRRNHSGQTNSDPALRGGRYNRGSVPVGPTGPTASSQIIFGQHPFATHQSAYSKSRSKASSVR